MQNIIKYTVSLEWFAKKKILFKKDKETNERLEAIAAGKQLSKDSLLTAQGEKIFFVADMTSEKLAKKTFKFLQKEAEIINKGANSQIILVPLITLVVTPEWVKYESAKLPEYVFFHRLQVLLENILEEGTEIEEDEPQKEDETTTPGRQD